MARRIDFLIGGAQKAGTTALANYLARQRHIVLPACKEAHVFDAPEFDDAHWTSNHIEALYAQTLGADQQDQQALHGDATPIYLLHPTFVDRIHRYNPSMRWIVLLRDPIDRAVSQYHMERRRGNEHLPILAALFAERYRLSAHRNNFRLDSPLRHHSYRLRSDYGPQLRWLLSKFPREQVLLLHSENLRRSENSTLVRIHSFLGLSRPNDDATLGEAFTGDYTRWGARDWRRRMMGCFWRREISDFNTLISEAVTEG